MKAKRLVCIGALVMVCVQAEASYPETREYLLGDIDGFVYDGPGSEDGPYVDANFLLDWVTPAAAGYANGVEGFDDLSANHALPFTFQFDLVPQEQAVGGSLTIAMRALPGAVGNDRIDLEPDRGAVAETFFRYDFTDLGWLPISDQGTSTRTIDLGNALGCYDHPDVGDNLLPLLEDGRFNVMVHDDVAIDYATLTIEVVPQPAMLALLGFSGLALIRRRG